MKAPWCLLILGAVAACADAPSRSGLDADIDLDAGFEDAESGAPADAQPDASFDALDASVAADAFDAAAPGDSG